MKKLIFISLFFVLAIFANAQKGLPVSIASDTVNGNETIYFETETFSQNWDLTIQVLCTNIGGTSDGTIRLEQSVDGNSWETVTDEVGYLKSYPNDTLTILNAAVGQWVLSGTPVYKYRLAVAGTASDSTLITPVYIRK